MDNTRERSNTSDIATQLPIILDSYLDSDKYKTGPEDSSEQLKERIERMQQDIQACAGIAKHYLAQSNNLTESLEVAENKVKVLTKQSKHFRKDNERMESELRRKTEKLELLQVDMIEKDGKFAQMKQSNRNLEKTVKAFEKEVIELSENARKVAEAPKLKTLITQIASQEPVINPELEKAQQQLKDLQSSLDWQVAQVSGLKNDIEEGKEREDATQKELDKSTDLLNKLKRQNHSLETQVESQNDEIDILQSRLSTSEFNLMSTKATTSKVMVFGEESSVEESEDELDSLPQNTLSSELGERKLSIQIDEIQPRSVHFSVSTKQDDKEAQTDQMNQAEQCDQSSQVLLDLSDAETMVTLETEESASQAHIEGLDIESQTFLEISDAQTQSFLENAEAWTFMDINTMTSEWQTELSEQPDLSDSSIQTEVEAQPSLTDAETQSQDEHDAAERQDIESQTFQDISDAQTQSILENAEACTFMDINTMTSEWQTESAEAQNFSDSSIQTEDEAQPSLNDAETQSEAENDASESQAEQQSTESQTEPETPTLTLETSIQACYKTSEQQSQCCAIQTDSEAQTEEQMIFEASEACAGELSYESTECQTEVYITDQEVQCDYLEDDEHILFSSNLIEASAQTEQEDLQPQEQGPATQAIFSPVLTIYNKPPSFQFQLERQDYRPFDLVSQSDVSTEEERGINRRNRAQARRKGPVEEYFQLTCQAAKLNSPNMEKICVLPVQHLYTRAIQENIPFNRWHQWVANELEELASIHRPAT